MSRSEYLKELSSAITDPEKMRKLLDIPESILAIVTRVHSITEEEGKKLDRYPLARKARAINYNHLADYESPQHKKWCTLEDKFKSNPDYIPFTRLIDNPTVLKMIKTEIPSHLRQLDDELGIEVIGAIPKRQNRVELLIEHNQYRCYTKPGNYRTQELDTFSYKKYNIPRVATTGELKKYDPNGSILTFLAHDLAAIRGENSNNTRKDIDLSIYKYFFAISLIDAPSNYYEFSLPIK